MNPVKNAPGFLVNTLRGLTSQFPGRFEWAEVHLAEDQMRDALADCETGQYEDATRHLIYACRELYTQLQAIDKGAHPGSRTIW